jgi:hypothetical protein
MGTRPPPRMSFLVWRAAGCPLGVARHMRKHTESSELGMRRRPKALGTFGRLLSHHVKAGALTKNLPAMQRSPSNIAGRLSGGIAPDYSLSSP